MTYALSRGIVSTANALGMDPVDLATIISSETGGTFNPTQRGPTTQWRRHRGLIQFGEPQARQYGVGGNDPLGRQRGENGAIANYFRNAGWQPGMGMLDCLFGSKRGSGGPLRRIRREQRRRAGHRPGQGRTADGRPPGQG